MGLIDTAEVRKLLETALDDLDVELYYRIKRSKPAEQRQQLLAQVDMLEIFRKNIHARIDSIAG